MKGHGRRDGLAHNDHARTRASVRRVSAGLSPPRSLRAEGGESVNSVYPIEARGLSRRFSDVVAVDGLDLRVPEGIIYGFLGPNGAGKSTTIKMLTCLLAPTKGDAFVCGHDIHRDPLAVKRSVGVVPEELGLYERLTGAEQIELVARLYGLDRDEIARRRAPLLQMLGLADDADKMVLDYSSGMRKKTALACALIHAPQVLFLDEPFSGVDPVSTSTIKRLLRRMVDERRTTVFFSTHVMELAQAFCDRVGIIHKGRLVAEGSIPELREQAHAPADAPLEDVFVRLVGGPGTDVDDLLAWLHGEEAASGEGS